MNINLLEKKSGQATLIIIMVTLAAVVGVAATSSTQTSYNLRNTVYGVQSEQALACAEAGAEKLLGQYSETDSPISGGFDDILGTLTGSECQYDAIIRDYPDNSGEFSIPRLNENSVIQLKISRDISPEIDELIPLVESSGDYDGQIAVYIYDEDLADPGVERRMIHCGSTSRPDDFEDGNFSGSSSSCTNIDLGNIDAGSILRIRALNNDFKLNFTGFVNGGNAVPVGHYIESIGVAGSVERTVSVYRFYRQLPDFFDETIAILD